MSLPAQYKWLEQEGAPKMLVEFLKIYGVVEAPGDNNDNPIITGWAKEIGVDKDYKHDLTPWCGLAVGVLAKRAGKDIPSSPLWALSWANFGSKAPEPMLGDVLVFKRTGGGHVGLYIGEDDQAYHVGAGNQGDKVSIARIEKSRLYAARRPVYSIGQPVNVRKVILKATGELSTNEQ